MASVCNICSEKLFVVTKDISALPCGHTFHRTCLDKWWAVKKECPNCRRVCKVKIDKLYFEKYEEALTELKQTVAYLQNALKTKEKIKKLMEDILRKKIYDARLEQCTLKSSLVDQQKEILKLHKENNALVSELEHVNIRRSSLEDGMRRSRDAVRPLVNRMSGVREKLRTYHEENDRLQGEISDQRQLLKTTKQKLNDLQTACEQKLEIANREIKQLKLAVTAAKFESDALKQDLDKSRIRVEELERELTELRQRNEALSNLEAANAALQEKLTNVENQLLENTTATNARQLAELGDQYSKVVDNENDEVTDDGESSEPCKASLEVEVGVMSSEFEIDALKQDLERCRSKFDGLEHQLTDFRQRNQAASYLETENLALQEKLTKVENQLYQNEVDNARQLAELRDQYAAIVDTQTEAFEPDATEPDSAATAVMMAEFENEALKQDLDKSRIQVEELEHQLADLRQRNRAISHFEEENAALQEKLIQVERQLLEHTINNARRMSELVDQCSQVDDKESDELSDKVGSLENINAALAMDLETTQEEIKALRGQLEFCDRQMAEMVPQMLAAVESKPPPSCSSEHRDDNVVVNRQSDTFISKLLTDCRNSILQIWTHLQNYWAHPVVHMPRGHCF